MSPSEGVIVVVYPGVASVCCPDRIAGAINAVPQRLGVGEVMIIAVLRNATVSSRCSSACMLRRSLCACSAGQCNKMCSAAPLPLLQRGKSALGV